MRYIIVCSALLLAVRIAAAQVKTVAKQASTEPIDGVSGSQTYQQYCASCHGQNAKGGGPLLSRMAGNSPMNMWVA